MLVLHSSDMRRGGVKCMVAYSSINDARHVCVAMRNGLVSQFLFYVFVAFCYAVI